jgi:hypothetical protein
MINFFTLAIQSLRPNSEFSLSGRTYEGLNWLDKNQTKPSKGEVETEAVRLEQLYIRNEYQRNRAMEYPPIADYIDGVVKGDQEQIDAYIAACMAVKEKYPKPE